MINITTKSISQEIKLVTDDGDCHYVYLSWDSEFKHWEARLSMDSCGASMTEALRLLIRQCKDLGDSELPKSIDGIL